MSVSDERENARALAQGIVTDIATYHGDAPANGEDLRRAIAEGRALFQGRVAPSLHDSFEEVLAETQLAGGRSAQDVTPKGAKKKTRYSISLLAPLLIVGALGVGWWLFRVPGDVVGEITVPGSLDLAVGVGDELAFTADTDVLFDRPNRKAVPNGCSLQLSLLRDGVELATTRCNLFKTSDSTNFAASSNASQVEGKTRLEISGQRLGCRLTVPSSGASTLRASSNIDTCVPRSYKVVTQVRLSRASEE